jgi:hypothetical protein
MTGFFFRGFSMIGIFSQALSAGFEGMSSLINLWNVQIRPEEVTLAVDIF